MRPDLDRLRVLCHVRRRPRFKKPIPVTSQLGWAGRTLPWLLAGSPASQTPETEMGSRAVWEESG